MIQSNNNFIKKKNKQIRSFFNLILLTIGIVGTYGWLRLAPFSIMEKETSRNQPWVPTIN